MAVRAQPITGAILVGGRARRFGGQVKSILPVGGHTILDRQLDVFRRAGIDQVLLVGRWNAPAVTPPARHVPDVVGGLGPLGGLYSALLLAATPVVVVMAGDMPFVQLPLVRHLMTIADSEEAVVPCVDGRWHPLAAAYRRSVATGIKSRLDRGDLRMSDALNDLKVREVTVDDLLRIATDDWLLTNVNTPDDHRQADDHARARA